MDLIIFFIISVAIGYRLYLVLGKKDFNPDNVEQLIATRKQQIIEAVAEEHTHPEKEDLTGFDATTVKAIETIQKHDPEFTVESFTSGAKVAFEWIVKAYAAGDLETLQPLLGKEEFAEFENAILGKEAKHHTEEIVIVSEPDITISSIRIERSVVRITTTIISEQIEYIKNQQGDVVEGDTSQIDEMTDIWIFERNLKSNDPNWLLVATEMVN